MNGDVHQLRGIRLEGLKRDPSHFWGGRKVDPAHIEECFDADTLFYDVFFEPTNRRLVAVGPPLGNLKLDLQLWVNREPVEFKVIKRAARRLHLLTASPSRIAEQNDILIRADGHQWQLRVPANNTGTGHKFTLCTLQKDNRERWIRDWIEHYRKIGVDRVILYHNSSSKPPDVDAIVIPCPYKYGLDKYLRLYGRRLRRNGFLQRGLLTICGYKYRSGQLLNFDIDELLQVEGLEKYGKSKLIYFNSYFIETSTEGNLPKDYSFRHFVYRNTRTRNRSYKYMVRMDALLYSHGPHRAILKGNFVPRWLVLGLQRLRSRLKARLPRKLTSKMAPQGEDVFYHYKGINTGWKLDRSSFDENAEAVKIGN